MTADSRAFILAMCNILRLTAASLPRTAFLADFLFAHEQWKAFLPTLLQESAAQQPRAHVATAKAIVPQLTPAWHRLPTYNAADGLDLGSSFSHALGFGSEHEESIEIGGRAVSEDDSVPRRPSAKAPPLRAAASMRGNLRSLATAAATAPAVAPPPAPATTTATPTAATGSPVSDKKKKKKKKKEKKGHDSDKKAETP